MTYILLFIIVFLLLMLFFTIYYRNKIGKEKKLSEVRYFKKKFDLNIINFKKFYNGIAIINSLIIAFVTTFLMYMDIVWELNYALELIIGFIILFLLIYSLYEIYGRILKKRGRFEKWKLKQKK